jgi:hypothetical protein
VADGGAEAPQRAKLEVADIFRLHGEVYRQQHMLTPQQQKVMRAIEQCRTAALGGHLEVCLECGYNRPAYNSCRDRHCPKCQSLRQAEWIAARKERLLEVPYFHVVFTLPAALRRLCRRNDRELYNLLFESASTTLLRLGEDPERLGAKVAFTAVLHTWTRELDYHPHLHCIVTAGGLSLDETQFVHGSPRYLFPVKVMAALFRGLFLDGLAKMAAKGKIRSDGEDLQPLLDSLYQTDWVVYAKRPFGGAEQVFEYLGRYTHRTGISNQRLHSMDAEGVCFATKGGRRITLSPQEFIRRFLLHVLPPGFVKIRHYGLWATGRAQQKLLQARTLLFSQAKEPAVVAALPEDAADLEQEAEPDLEETEGVMDFAQKMLELCGVDVTLCPNCQRGRLVRQPLPETPQVAVPKGADTS